MLLPFDSVHDALKWYFSRPWRSPGNYERTNWPDGDKVDSSPWQVPIKENVRAFLSIAGLLNGLLTARDRAIIEKHYAGRSAVAAEVAFDYPKTERGVGFVRNRVMERLRPAFIVAGIVRPPRWDDPVYAKDEDQQKEVER